MVNMWKLKRQLVGIIVFSSIALLVVGSLVYFISTYGTCSDNIQNQDETGIDCGGSCQVECLVELPKDPVQLWVRFFKTGSDTYDVAALVQNVNQQLGGDLHYNLKLFSEESAVIASGSGIITLYPSEKVLLFVPNIVVENFVPKRVQLQMVIPEWKNTARADIPVSVISQKFYSSPSPRVEAVVKNESLFPVRDIWIAVFLHNEDGNVYAVSRTVIDQMQGSEERTIAFTWPRSSLLNMPQRITFLMTPPLSQLQ